jgi:predicted phage terminase large subunit-like protein
VGPEEVVHFLGCVTSPRQRAVLTTCCAAGLRVSETVHPRRTDLDSRRMTIRVQQGKGRRDRYVAPGEADCIILKTTTRDGRGVTISEEMEAGSAGNAVCVARAKTVAGCDYKGIPASGDKVTRWRSFPAQAEAGNVDVLRGEWTREWFDELASAPFSAHDDQADSAAGAFTELAPGKHGGGAVRLAGW